MILTTWTLADGTTDSRTINAPLQEVLDRVWRKFGDTSKPLGGGSEFDRVNAEGKIQREDEGVYAGIPKKAQGRAGASKRGGGRGGYGRRYAA